MERWQGKCRCFVFVSAMNLHEKMAAVWSLRVQSSSQWFIPPSLYAQAPHKTLVSRRISPRNSPQVVTGAYRGGEGQGGSDIQQQSQGGERLVAFQPWQQVRTLSKPNKAHETVSKNLKKPN